MTLSLLLVGCMSLDSFLFAGTPLDAYTLPTDIIPTERMELVTFPTTEDGTLHGLWARQEQPGAETLVYFHGNADHIDHYMAMVEDYWLMGYDVFTFDYRGFGRSEGDPTYTRVMADGVAAADYVAATVGVDSTDLLYLGLSLGGSVSVHTAGSRPPRVLITEDMFASAEKLMQDGSGLTLPGGWMTEDEWDNALAAESVFVPYLVIHGDSDTYIQPSHAERVYAHANDPKALWLVPGADHAEASEVDPEAYAAAVTCWFDQACPGGPG